MISDKMSLVSLSCLQHQTLKAIASFTLSITSEEIETSKNLCFAIFSSRRDYVLSIEANCINPGKCHFPVIRVRDQYLVIQTYILHIIQRFASTLHWEPRKEALIVTG